MEGDLKQFALFYHNFGFNVTHILPERQINYNGEFEYVLKSPSHNIKNLRTKRQSENEVLEFNWENATGVGTVIGFNDLRAIDIDECTNELFLFEFLRKIGLPNNYEWVVRTGSHNGFHIIFYTDPLFCLSRPGPGPSNFSLYAMKEYLNIFKHIDILSTNHIVLPPSLHQSGKKYDFLSGKKPTSPPARIKEYPIIKHLSEICQPISLIDQTGHYCENFLSENFRFISLLDSEGYQTGVYKEPFYFFIDIETNGLPVNFSDPELNPDDYPEIIQIATLCCDSDGKLISQATKYIFPDGYEINEDIKRLINLDEEKMKYQGMYLRAPKQEKLPLYSYHPIKNDYIIKGYESYEWLTRCHFSNLFSLLGPLPSWMGRSPVGYIVGHNIEYDLNCLKALFARNKTRSGCELFNKNLDGYFLTRIKDKKTICTMKNSTEFCQIPNQYGYKYPNLQELHFKLFHTSFKGAHDASNDVYHTAKCYWRLRDLGFIE